MFGIRLGFRLTRAFLCAPVALANIFAEHFKQWKSPRLQDPTCNVPVVARRPSCSPATRVLTCNAFAR